MNSENQIVSHQWIIGHPAIVYKNQKIFSEKQKGFRDGLSYSTPQKREETSGISPSFFFERWSMTGHP